MICQLRLIANCFLPFGEGIDPACTEDECPWWIKRIVVSEKELDKAGCAIKKIAERIL